MAEILKLSNIQPLLADNIVVESKYVKGSYVVVADTTERDALKGTSGENIVEGSLCYCISDKKFYQYTKKSDGTFGWMEKQFGVTTEASTAAAGLMSPTDKAKLDKLDGSSYALKTVKISAGTGLSGGGNISNDEVTLNVDYGSAEGTVCEGNDSRLSDTRTPREHDHGSIKDDGTLSAASMVVVTDSHNKVTTSSNISTTELDHLNGVTSNVQEQLDTKANKDDVISTSSTADTQTILSGLIAEGVTNKFGNLYIQYFAEDDHCEIKAAASDETYKPLKINASTITFNSQVIAPSFNALSDACLKENFKPFIPERSILDLPTYKFDFIEGAKDQIGCKAQDLQEICPEIVNEGSDGYLSIQESKIVYLLLDEIKKLRKEVDELKRR